MATEDFPSTAHESMGGASAFNQGQFSTCALYAAANCMHDMIGLKYGIWVPQEDILNYLENQARDPASPIFGAQENGSTIEEVCAAMNRGNHGSRAPNRHQIWSKSEGKEFAITVDHKRCTFEQLRALLQHGAGRCIAYVAVQTTVAGHGSHAVAAFGLEFGSPQHIVARNSWGLEKSSFVVTTANFKYAAIVFPHIHAIKKNGGATEDVPSPGGEWHAFDDLFKTYSYVTEALAKPVVLVKDIELTGKAAAGKYTGEFKSGLPCGFGSICFSGGKRYEGFWEGGLMEGHGKLFRTAGALAYEGTWKAGKKHGFARRFSPNTGDIYEGQFVEGKAHGQGVVRWANGNTWTGQWKEGNLEGAVVFHQKSDGQYFLRTYEHGKQVKSEKMEVAGTQEPEAKRRKVGAGSSGGGGS